MYLIGSLILGFAITIFLVSKIAEMLHAKKPDIGHVFLASFMGSIAALLALFAIGLFASDGLEPLVMLTITIAVMFIVSSMAFKLINKMNWAGAITTNVANIALSLIAVTTAVVLNGGELDETIGSITGTYKQTTGIAESVVQGDLTDAVQTDAVAAIDEDPQLENNEDGSTGSQLISDKVAQDETDLEPTVSELALLHPAAANEIKQKQNKVIKSPKYHVISLGNIRSLVGKPIRIINTNGNSFVGSLKTVTGGDAVIEQRLAGGLAITPVSLAKIQKLEVYR